VRQERRADFSTYAPDRVWIPAGKSTELVFVDDTAISFEEHNAHINGNWKNWMTCAAPITDEGEPECCRILGKDSRYRVTMLTVVDCSKWTDKKGNVHQYEVKVLPAKYKTAQKLERKSGDLAKEGKSLIGRLYKVVRETDKSPSVGDEYEFTRDVDLGKLFSLATYKGKKLSDLWDKADESAEEYAKLARVFAISKGADGKVVRKLVPFRYEAVFAPKLPKEIRETLGNYTRPAEDEPAPSKGADETVPF
jgi:hypothetical protein